MRISLGHLPAHVTRPKHVEQVEGAKEGMKNALHNKDSAITQIFIQPVSLTPSDHGDSCAA